MWCLAACCSVQHFLTPLLAWHTGGSFTCVASQVFRPEHTCCAKLGGLFMCWGLFCGFPFCGLRLSCRITCNLQASTAAVVRGTGASFVSSSAELFAPATLNIMCCLVKLLNTLCCCAGIWLATTSR